LAAGGEGGMSPSAILDAGFAMVDRVLTEASLFSSEGWALLICAILLTAVFAYMAGKVLVALIEMYVVTAGGVVLLAFGGSRFTVDFALAYLRYLVAIGAKLFFLALIIGLGQTFINDWLAALGTLTLKQVLMLFGAAFVLAFIVNDIPAMVAGLIAGSSAGVGERVVDFGRQALGRAVEAPVASTPAVAASVLAVKEAASLARAQGAHGVTGTMSGTARHLASAAADDLGGQFAGLPGHQHGYRGARMAASLRAQRLEMKSPARPPESDNTLGPGKPPSGASPSGGGSAPASNPSRSRYISPLNNYGKDTDDD
jgi:type IV secretion system protein TrbL